METINPIPSQYERPQIACCYSSLLFVTNVIVAYNYGYYLYSALFAAMTITSIIHHSTKSFTTYWIDKIIVFAVVGYGGYILFDKIAKGNVHEYQLLYYPIIVGAFLGTIVLYYYGRLHKCFCFAEDLDECDRWHQLLHLITSMGHNFIVIL